MPKIAKPAIVIDFDRVLFDADAFRTGLRDSVRPLGVSVKRWQTAYERCSPEGIFRIVDMAEYLSAAVEQPVERFTEAFAGETADATWYLHADARPFLNRFAGVFTMYLLAFGDPGLQQQKIAAAGIEQFFNGAYCVEDIESVHGVLPLSSVDRAVFINDDVTDMLEIARHYRWSHHLHINRGKPVEKPMPFPSYRDLADAGDAVAELLDSQGAGVRADSVPNQGSQAT